MFCCSHININAYNNSILLYILSFFKGDDSGRLGKLSRQQSNEIVSSAKSLLDGARPLTPIQDPSLPFLSSTNNAYVAMDGGCRMEPPERINVEV